MTKPQETLIHCRLLNWIVRPRCFMSPHGYEEPFDVYRSRNRLSQGGGQAMSAPTPLLAAVRRWVNRLVRRIACACLDHLWVYDNPYFNERRLCVRCGRRERYVLVDFGRCKMWVTEYSPNARRSAAPEVKP